MIRKRHSLLTMKIEMTDENSFPFPVTINVPAKRVQDLLCNAFEGGSNYWYEIKEFVYPENLSRKDVEYPHLELPFIGGTIIVGDNCNDMPDKELSQETIKSGLNLLAKKYPHHFADFIAENDDATTGDVFLQLCLYEEIVFG